MIKLLLGSSVWPLVITSMTKEGFQHWTRNHSNTVTNYNIMMPAHAISPTDADPKQERYYPDINRGIQCCARHANSISHMYVYTVHAVDRHSFTLLFFLLQSEAQCASPHLPPECSRPWQRPEEKRWQQPEGVHASEIWDSVELDKRLLSRAEP